MKWIQFGNSDTFRSVGREGKFYALMQHMDGSGKWAWCDDLGSHGCGFDTRAEAEVDCKDHDQVFGATTEKQLPCVTCGHEDRP